MINIKNLPFVSYYRDEKENKDIYCVVNAVSKDYISYFNVEKLHEEDIEEFISLITYWYNKSDRKIPLTVYFHSAIDKFKYCYSVETIKKLSFISGYIAFSLRNISDKRIKRTIITIPES